jgi:hypothetical protein
MECSCDEAGTNDNGMRTPKEDSSEMVLIVKTIEPSSFKLFYAQQQPLS